MSQSVEQNAPQPKVRSIEPLEQPEFNIKLNNVQGDVFPTFPKKAEAFLFFTIADSDSFRPKLARLVPHVTTSAQVIHNVNQIKELRLSRLQELNPGPRRLIKLEQTSIAFSAKGLARLGVESQIGDDDFQNGQGAQAISRLGDKPLSADGVEVDWDPEFKQEIHGVVLVAAETIETVRNTLTVLLRILGDSINVVNIIEGKNRPADQDGHEHFGFLDGISEPALRGLAKPHKGQLECDPGVVIFGYKGDPSLKTRPKWTKDGSIMVFRKLAQRVPEFNDFLEQHPVEDSPDQTLTLEEKVALRGARFVGRWKSGAPLDLAPVRDQPELAQDVDLSNAFDYTKLEPSEAATQIPGQFRCPFAAHIRKTAPRAGTSLINKAGARIDLEKSMIVRAGIPYGDEVSTEEQTEKKTSQDRGLCFVSYQTVLGNGFRFMQESWANNARFPPQAGLDPTPGSVTGPDPVIGNNVGPNRTRQVFGTNAKDFSKDVTLTEDFVTARGGEYFFVPSISTLRSLAKNETLGPEPATDIADSSTVGGAQAALGGGAVTGGAVAGGADASGGDAGGE